MLRRMIWNPCWNESLYVMACAERLIKLQDEDTQKQSAEQIAQRIRRHFPNDTKTASFKFRLVFMRREDEGANEGTGIERHLLYLSDIYVGEGQ